MVINMIRLDKFLADMQVGTRSQVKEYIRKGSITVNGNIIKKPEYKIDETIDLVTCMGKKISYSKYKYYMLHKPAGVVTATKDNVDKTVMDLFSADVRKNLFPVGRLDKDTEGLLLVTNDGELSHNLLSPKKHVSKTYYVECDGIISEDKIKQLQDGVDIGDDKLTLPAMVRLMSDEISTYKIELTIVEGRFHQIKRMIKAIGGEVTYLKRIAMGDLLLDENLEKGCYRELTQDEILKLTKN